jgi:hypothetical protein
VTTFLEKYPGGNPEILGDSGKHLRKLLQKIQFTGCIIVCICKISSRGLREISGDPKNPEILENFDKILEKKKFWKFWKIFAKFFTKCKKLKISGGITLQKDKFTAVIKCATSEKLWKK